MGQAVPLSLSLFSSLDLERLPRVDTDCVAVYICFQLSMPCGWTSLHRAEEHFREI